MTNMMTKLKMLGVALLATIAIAANAASSYTYTWVTDPQPPAPRGYSRITARGHFTVTAEAVEVRGVITQADVISFSVVLSSPQVYPLCTGGVILVNPLTGVLGDGYLTSTGLYTYSHYAQFYANEILTSGGPVFHGQWIVTANP